MRTTVDLPDDLIRRVKAVAALRGMKLKELLTAFIEQGLEEMRPSAPRVAKSDLTVLIPKTGRKIQSLTNAEIEEILLREDVGQLGLDRSA